MAVYLEIYKGGNVGEYIQSLFDKINFIPKGTIFIKPNFCARPPVHKGENTDTKFIDYLADLLISYGCQVLIGHTSLLGIPDNEFPFDKIINQSKTKFLRPHPKVKLIDLDKQQKKIINYNNFNFEIPKILFEVDSYINVAKLKTHMQTGVSLSLKNQMGLLSPQNKIDFHLLEIDKLIADLARVLVPKISLIDGVIGMEENGPHHGKAKKANLIFCGDDMVELDSFACRMIGFDFQEINHIRLAKEAGVGKFVDESLINKHKDNIIKFKPAENFIIKWRKIYVWPSSACSKCNVLLNGIAKNIKHNPFNILKLFIKNSQRINIIYGNCKERKLNYNEKYIGLGDCAKDFCLKNKIEFLNGCPPDIESAKAFLYRLFGIGA